jgi:hypothetical protein
MDIRERHFLHLHPVAVDETMNLNRSQFFTSLRRDR